jgi:hypothetical protein
VRITASPVTSFLKTTRDASPELFVLAGKYSDRLSIHAELPIKFGSARLTTE